QRGRRTTHASCVDVFRSRIHGVVEGAGRGGAAEPTAWPPNRSSLRSAGGPPPAAWRGRQEWRATGSDRLGPLAFACSRLPVTWADEDGRVFRRGAAAAVAAGGRDAAAVAAAGGADRRGRGQRRRLAGAVRPSGADGQLPARQ